MVRLGIRVRRTRIDRHQLVRSTMRVRVRRGMSGMVISVRRWRLLLLLLLLLLRLLVGDDVRVRMRMVLLHGGWMRLLRISPTCRLRRRTQCLEVNWYRLPIRTLFTFPHQLGVMQAACITERPCSIGATSPLRSLSDVTRMAFPWRGGAASLPIFALGLTRRIATGARRTLAANDFHVSFGSRFVCDIEVLGLWLFRIVAIGGRSLIARHVLPWTLWRTRGLVRCTRGVARRSDTIARTAAVLRTPQIFNQTINDIRPPTHVLHLLWRRLDIWLRSLQRRIVVSKVLQHTAVLVDLGEKALPRIHIYRVRRWWHSGSRIHIWWGHPRRPWESSVGWRRRRRRRMVLPMFVGCYRRRIGVRRRHVLRNLRRNCVVALDHVRMRICIWRRGVRERSRWMHRVVRGWNWDWGPCLERGRWVL